MKQNNHGHTRKSFILQRSFTALETSGDVKLFAPLPDVLLCKTPAAVDAAWVAARTAVVPACAAVVPAFPATPAAIDPVSVIVSATVPATAEARNSPLARISSRRADPAPPCVRKGG